MGLENNASVHQAEPTRSPIMFAPKFKAKAPPGGGIWTPPNQTPSSSKTNLNEIEVSSSNAATPTPPLQLPHSPWTTQALPASKPKGFRPVHFNSPTLPRRFTVQPYQDIAPQHTPSSRAAASTRNLSTGNYCESHTQRTQLRSSNSCTNLNTPNTTISYNTDDVQYNTPVDSAAAPISELGKIGTVEKSASVSELQGLTESHTLKNDIQATACRPTEVNAAFISNKALYEEKQEHMIESKIDDHRSKMAQPEPRQYDGIGPVTNDGMPIILRSEVKGPYQHEWYKRLYKTIHKQNNTGDYVIRYKCSRGPYQIKANGYVSEPEPSFDSGYSTVKYGVPSALDRGHLRSTSASTTIARHACQDEDIWSSMPNPIEPEQTSFKNQPGRMEDYITGNSSVSGKEKKVHLDQAKLSPHYTGGNLSRALAKESGYNSDSNIVIRKREAFSNGPLSPVEQKQVYRSVQAGGQPPLCGFRKPAPEKRKESPNRYLESDVNIHFKTPIRYEYKDPIPEDQLAIYQAEKMQQLYQEERRRKYLQELQDMNSRRHADNFPPSQKSPIPLNRYDEFPSDLAPKSPNVALQPKTIARALYNFQGQTAKELTFRKGDIIYIRRHIDKNWYEGEHNAMIGLLPANYVEITSKDGVRQLARTVFEGQARAKYNFQAQSGIELSLKKGELVTLTRRVDNNWFEGKIANRKGIFPVSYVEVLNVRESDDFPTSKLTDAASSGETKPSVDSKCTNVIDEINILQDDNHNCYGILKERRNILKTDMLHVDTSTNPIAYRSLYKYRPQNSDELELQEGDIVHVLEKCDDGWYVGTSQSTGCFGTFPGNYVERA